MQDHSIQKQDFIKALKPYYLELSRELAWRYPEADGSFNPYKILVSEIMLQQTQVNRVTSKYIEFLRKFPDVSTLANAKLGDVLIAWNGLGYNRRAKFLWQAAQVIESDYDGNFPKSEEELMKLPGVGKNTAGAIQAYAYNMPSVFIETNIRTVYIHHFFNDSQNISDNQINRLLGETLDTANPRKFYWALMDYGTHLKQTRGNNIRQSQHYKKQSKFDGSVRKIRGEIIKVLTNGEHTYKELFAKIHDDRLMATLGALVNEGLIINKKDKYLLS